MSTNKKILKSHNVWLTMLLFSIAVLSMPFWLTPIGAGYPDLLQKFAIFGIFGALAGFFLAHRERIQEHTKAFMKDFSIIIVINIVLGLSIPSIDMSAHIGGLIVGFIGGFVLSKNPKWILTYSIAMVLLIIAIGSYLPNYYVQTLL